MSTPTVPVRFPKNPRLDGDYAIGGLALLHLIALSTCGKNGTPITDAQGVSRFLGKSELQSLVVALTGYAMNPSAHKLPLVIDPAVPHKPVPPKAATDATAAAIKRLPTPAALPPRVG